MAKHTARKPRKPGRCIFCNSTGLSKEHVFSDWLKEFIPVVPSSTQTIFRESFPGPGLVEGFQIVKPRQGNFNQIKVRNVCRPCNNGWMASIVSRSKVFVAKMIRSKPVTLNRQNQTDVAAWIALVSIMAEFTDPTSAGILDQDRKAILKNKCPPSSWLIYIGGYSGTKWGKFHYRHYGFRFFFEKVPKTLQSTTFTIDSLLIHAFSSTESTMVSDYRSNHVHSGLFQLWPLTTDSLDCPVGAVVGDDYIDVLVHTYKAVMRR
jgi:hypothetical protein